MSELTRQQRALVPAQQKVALALHQAIPAVHDANVTELEDCDAPDEGHDHRILPLDAFLGDWLLIAHFTAPDGDDGYVQLSSEGITDHARMGLAQWLHDRA